MMIMRNFLFDHNIIADKRISRNMTYLSNFYYPPYNFFFNIQDIF